MGDIANAARVVLKPAAIGYDTLVIGPYRDFCNVTADFTARYLLGSRIGRVFTRSVIAPSTSYLLARFFENRDLLKPLGNVPNQVKALATAGATLLNCDLLNIPVTLAVSYTSIAVCREMYGPQAQQAAFEFFFLCQEMDGRLVGIELGSGNVNNTNNAYFPHALMHGVHDLHDQELSCNILQEGRNFEKDIIDNSSLGRFYIARTGDSDNAEVNEAFAMNHKPEYHRAISAPVIPRMSESKRNTSNGTNPQNSKESQHSDDSDNERERHQHSSDEGEDCCTESKVCPKLRKLRLEVAMTCLLFSTLTYRTDEQLKTCQKAGMLPGVDVFTVTTGQSGTSLMAFISKDPAHKWGVFSFRGTQFEVIRQMLTSLDFELEYFHSNDSFDPKKPAKIRKVYYREVKKSCTLFEFDNPFDEQKVTPLELLQLLSHRGYKLYITGHSLGGGLAQVLGAFAVSVGVTLEAVITFGATPVGDASFVDWYAKHIPCSWRFVMEDEFAPLVPPIPFSTAGADLVHVAGLIHFRPPTLGAPKNGEEIERMLTGLAKNTGLMKIIADHNPMLVMDAFKQFRMGGTHQLFLSLQGKNSEIPAAEVKKI